MVTGSKKYINSTLFDSLTHFVLMAGLRSLKREFETMCEKN